VSAAALAIPLRKPPQSASRENKPIERGQITELIGQAGRSTMAHTEIAQATRQGQICALIDASNAWNPAAAAAQGADLSRILWVRCGGHLQKAMQATDLVLRAGGFGVIWLDLGGVSAQALSRVPLSHWYRFRRSVENTDTALLVLARQTCTGATAHRKLLCEQGDTRWNGRLLEEMRIRVQPQKDFGAAAMEVRCLPA
jgi:RecA/RadA recombinase